ncbi:MAG TPA: tetratricopeptide repeat protein [Terriglobales bacterium]|nr:tetratricopeptide repeat protein [Terriglobales bacterium]
MKTSYKARDGEALVLFSVFAENGKTHLDRQAVLKITNQINHTVLWDTTDDKSEAALGLLFGKYEIEISAVGYLSERKEVQANNTLITTRIDVVLHHDPSAVDLNISDEAVPAKARGALKHGVSALKSANLKEARKSLDAAYKLAPSNPDINYLLGYVAYEEKDLAHARSYLATAANVSTQNVRALILLGQVELVQEDYPAAAATLEKAVDGNSDNWTAHSLLANAYLKLKKYDEARQQAELAIAKGKGGANTANLALGQALVNLGKKDAGIQALKIFVQNSPSDPAVPQVRDLIATLERPSATPLPGTAIVRTSSPVIDPIFATPELPVSINPWRPAGIDEAKPSVAEGVSCPVDSVIEMSGERVKQLVDDVSRISAIEHLVHEQVDEMGNSITKETRSYDYVASISEDKPGYLAVDENRLERMARADFPDRIASGGFATLALVFHPHMRENFEMTCEGLGNWHGQAAWVVHFKQRADRPALISEYNIGGEAYSLRLKGRAWITADKFEIVRIESELIDPMPQIQLRCEQQVVEYGPVQFKKNVGLWLPTKAEIYLDYRKHRYYRSHSYDHYLLFSVDMVDKPNEPKVPPTVPTEKPTAN